MAPITRRSQAGGAPAGGITRKKAPSRKPRAQSAKKVSSSWDFVDPQHAEDDDEEEEQQPEMQVNGDEDVRDSVEQHALELHNGMDTSDHASDLDEAINPLREMADKVGREAERFAIALDKFLQDLETENGQYGRYVQARETVSKFREFAQEAADDLRKSHEKETRQLLRKEWRAQVQGTDSMFGTQSGGLGLSRSSGLAGMKEEKVKELCQWQQEADLWDLFLIILELHYQPEESEQRDRAEKIAELPAQHRYTPESEVLSRFLLEDPVARKRSLIKKWLEQTAEHQASDLSAIVEELESSSGRGKGLWSRGWINTRESIKKEKRLRTWPSPSNSVQPQIRSSSGGDLLVTTLDPDAFARQQRSLEKPDAYFERAVWMACWEMLRRGASWENVREWCEERQEGWRAVAIGATSDDSGALSNAAWRKMCALAAQSGCSSEHEAAVYGLLGGDIEAMQKVCRSVDDHLYAYYSSMLVCQFDQYLLERYPERMVMAGSGRSGSAVDAVSDAASAEEAVMNLILKLRSKTSPTSNESVEPMKIIQSYLLADEAGSLITTLGTAVSDLSTQLGEEENMMIRTRPFDQHLQQPLPEAEVVVDPHALRIAAHISVILRAFRSDELEGEELATDENVLVSYIQALRSARKRDLILVYASKLSAERCITTMGRVLEDVTQSREQSDMLRLMSKTYHMDIVSIFTEQLNFQLDKLLGGAQTPEPLRILEKADNEKLYPGQRIMVDFLPDMLDDSDMAVVRSLQWFETLPGHWRATFNALSTALRKCLVAGRFACALEIVRNFHFEDIAKEKAKMVVGRSVNIMDRDIPQPTPGSHEAAAWEVLRQQSRTYYELDLLLHAIEALSHWATQERTYTSQPRTASGAPPKLKKAKDNLTEAMAPMLAGLLQTSMDTAEDEDLQRIRTTYIPEIVIAYNTALYTAGSTISRDNLLDAMDLSTIIAQDSNGISECFVKAGRMRELVDTFALMGKHMLVMKAEGGARKRNKKDRFARDLGLWEIGAQGGYDFEDSSTA